MENTYTDCTTSCAVLARRAPFLKSDGRIIDPDGISNGRFDDF